MIINKRYRVFKYPDCEDYDVVDDVAQYILATFNNYLEAESLCERLNELNDEKEQLKSELQSKQLGLSLFNSENTMLIEENDQLKQSVDLLEFEKIELQIKLQKIRDLAQEDGEIKQGVIEKVVMGYDDE